MRKTTTKATVLVLLTLAPLALAWNPSEKVTPENDQQQPFKVEVTASVTGQSRRFRVRLGVHEQTKAFPETVRLRLLAKTDESPMAHVASALVRPLTQTDAEEIYEVAVHANFCAGLSGLWICYQVKESGSLDYWIPFEAYAAGTDTEPEQEHAR